MTNRTGLWALASAIVIAAGAAAFGVRASPPSSPPPPAEPAPLGGTALFGVGDDPHAALPPGHPAIGSGKATPSSPRASAEPPAITWKAPAAWTEAPNPSSMRLATYHAPRKLGDDANPELSVSRAGGSTDANIERWIGQFDEAGKDTRQEKMVHGLKVTIVEVGGAYLGGAMLPSKGGARRPGYRLLGAVVEANGLSYFFKLTGPEASVRAAHAAFEAMIEGVAPVG